MQGVLKFEKKSIAKRLIYQRGSLQKIQNAFLSPPMSALTVVSKQAVLFESSGTCITFNV
jgi:hypothetical protein